MSSIKQAYEEGFVTKIKRRPITTTIIVGGLVYFLAKKFGGAITEFVQEKREESADASGAATSNVSPFNYSAFFNYWKAGGRFPKGVLYFTSSTANDICKKIYDAMGYITDDEDIVKAQFKRANSKVKIAQISERFTQLYQRDLLTYIKDGVGVRWSAGLDPANLDTIIKYVNSLPTYTK
jgi:hypothetical protein